MNKIVIFIILTSLLGCKRKQELRDLDGSQILAGSPATCYNSIMDGDETSIDCGGSCSPCANIQAPCTPSLNTLSIGSSIRVVSPNLSSGVGGNKIYTGSYSGGIAYYIEIGAGATSSYPSKKYTITTNSSVSNGNAYVYLTTSSFTFADFQLISGDIYLSSYNGKYIATICNAVGKYNTNISTYSFQGSFFE